MSLSIVSKQLEQWAASTAAKLPGINDPDRLEAMRKAEAQFRALQGMVRAAVVELESYRQLAARKPAKKAPKAAVMDAAEFWRLHGLAVQQIYWRYGPNWKVVAPFGETILVSVPSRFRSYKTERGTTIRWEQDHRMPAACFWAGERLPDGLTITPDYPRAWAGYGPPAPRSDEWMVAHGYVFHRGNWMPEILLRSQLAHEDAIVAEREAKRLAALELACLTYGPQPASVEELAEAAD